jgi:hypothetical protein
MTCPYLEYRRSDGEYEFDHERPFCSVNDEFVSPMKADICNDRFAFDHESDCEVFKGHVEEMVADSAATDD